MALAYNWESFIRIHGGEPGARDVFEKAIDELLRAENPDKEVHIVKASRGDGGIDIYVHHKNGIDIYQCKFFMGSMTSSRWSQIKASFDKAMEPKGVDVLRWYLCLPREMQKEDIQVWDQFQKERESSLSEVHCIDGNEIINRMQKCGDWLINKYFDVPVHRPFTNKDLIVPFTQGSSSGAQGNTYVPRHDLLDKIAACYDSQADKKRIVFLSGMGGCGKSELARAYAATHKDEYEEIFWLTCSDGETPELIALFSAANTLRTVEKSDAAGFPEEILIIVDNCNMDDPDFLHDLMNGTGKADILVTTRLPMMGDYDEQIIAVVSDDPERFAIAVFEKNYCKKPRWGRRKEIGDHEKTAVLDICREVQYNTMIVSLLGVRLREYSNLSISECANKIRNGVGTLKGKITYPKDQRSREMKDILRILFSDILNYPLTDAQREVLTLLSLTPASWYEMDFIFMLAGDGPQNTEHEYAAKTLLNFGWLQGTEDRMTIHPLIVEAINDEAIIIKDAAFFEAVLKNNLALPERYLGKEQFLVNKILNLAEKASPEIRISAMLLINHGGYKKLFSELHPDVNAAYFVRVDLQDTRSFEYRDLKKNKTYLLTELACQLTAGKRAELLKVYNTGVPYTLDTGVSFHGEHIKHIPSGLCRNDIYLSHWLSGESIESIGTETFFGCKGLTEKLHLPASLTSIGDRAFQGCSGLTGDLHLPDGMTTIGNSAFYDCRGLTGELFLPDGITTIGNSAFYCCRDLTGKLHLPNSLSSIGEAAFYGCNGLNGELHIPENLTAIEKQVFDGCNGLTGDFHLPDTLTTIGERAFYDCSNLSGELCFPKGLTTIGEETFYRCSGLTGELHLPSSLTSIGEAAFYDCTGLTGDLNLPNSLTTIGERAFQGCSGLTGELHLPITLTNIESHVFYKCSGLTGELHLPESLIIIEDHAFHGCSGLTGELNLPSALIEIGNSAFFGCSGLTGEFHLPDFLARIGNKAFFGCSGLTGELHLPHFLISIGNQAFFGCNKLTGNLRLPNTLSSTWEWTTDDINEWIRESPLPEDLSIIKEETLNDCSEPTNILPETLASTQDLSLDSCNRLTAELHFPEGISNIVDQAFEGCSWLSGELRLPDGITSIGAWAFYDCKGLIGELHLPNTLTSIGAWAFFGCSNLTGELHLPDNITDIGNSSFQGCSGLTGELHLPNSLASIGNRAFFGCSKLTGNLRLPNTLTSIFESTFQGCSGLTGQLHLPDGLTYIGEFAFSGCKGLMGDLYLPNSLREIEDRAFDNCKDINKIIFNNPNTIIKGNLMPFSPVIIIGHRHSTAEKYAHENGLVFAELRPETYYH